MKSQFLVLSILFSVSCSFSVDRESLINDWHPYFEKNGPSFEKLLEAKEKIPDTVIQGFYPLVSEIKTNTNFHNSWFLHNVRDLSNTLPNPNDKLDTLILWNIFCEMQRLFPDFLKDSEIHVPEVQVIFSSQGTQEVTTNLPAFCIIEKEGSLFKEVLPYVQQHQTWQILAKAVESSSILKDSIHTSSKNQSHCMETLNSIHCSHFRGVINTGIWIRNVLWQVPLGKPPAEGWPVVLHFQGSFFAPHLFSWDGAQWMPFGAYEQTKTIKYLLDAGYAVITPETHFNGYTFWDTNIPPYSFLWDLAPDHLFMVAILREIKKTDGLFGHLNYNRKYATGISSGGFMTSRMAVSYAGEFKALAISSGSYATCSFVCVVPPLPLNHPPTLFLHGALDPLVPIYTMELYESDLSRQGTKTKKVVDLFGFHEWIDGSAEAVLEWFSLFP